MNPAILKVSVCTIALLTASPCYSRSLPSEPTHRTPTLWASSALAPTLKKPFLDLPHWWSKAPKGLKKRLLGSFLILYPTYLLHNRHKESSQKSYSLPLTPSLLPSSPTPTWLLPHHLVLTDDLEEDSYEEVFKQDPTWDHTLEQAAEITHHPSLYSADEKRQAFSELKHFAQSFQLNTTLFIRSLKRSGNLLEALSHSLPPRRGWSYFEATQMLEVLEKHALKGWHAFDRLSRYGQGSRWAYLAENLLPWEHFQPGYLIFSWHAFPYTKQNLIEIHLKTYSILHRKDPEEFYQRILSREGSTAALNNTDFWLIRYPWQIKMLLLLLRQKPEVVEEYMLLEQEHGFPLGPFTAIPEDSAEEWLLWEKRSTEEQILGEKKSKFWQDFMLYFPQGIQRLDDPTIHDYITQALARYLEL